MRKLGRGIFLLLGLGACRESGDPEREIVRYGETYFDDGIHTDKSSYKPGEKVSFQLKNSPDKSAVVKYYHLGELIHTEPISGTSWTWNPPADDFKGYLVQVADGDKIQYSTAVDVSSDWKRFPRYGFLSSFGNIAPGAMENTINTLNRFHINGLQFYDWHYDHHKPLAGSAEKPQNTWTDIIGRTHYLSTVKGYIGLARQKNMNTLFYNLAMGALNNAPQDGVKDTWYIFKDRTHTQKDYHPLGPPFKSNIYLTNPANTEWQSYLADRNKEVYAALDFDGYHIDQLGNRGDVYDYSGQKVDLSASYKSFIEAMKAGAPGKRLVMNAVSQYGQENSISRTEVDFLYSEVWNETLTFRDLSQVILDNDSYSGRAKKTVLAAYMNYEKSKSKGYLNPPGILLANSVIFAFGGAHLELGEHYLSNEYFPNSNLAMKAGLKEQLLRYYDFLVAYQNLLRDGGEFGDPAIQSESQNVSMTPWPSGPGKVAAVSKKTGSKQVIHLINFTKTETMEWRDTHGTQKEPEAIHDLKIRIAVNGAVKKVWVASPDTDGGTPVTVGFTSEGNNIKFTLPSLKYWDMIVLEY